MTMVMYGSPRGMKAARAARVEGLGSIIRAGQPVAGERLGVDGHGMPAIEDFTDEVVADYRRRLALLGDSGDRRAIEDGIALLSNYRHSDIDNTRFEELLSTLCAGRSPEGLNILKPEAIGRELTRRWETYKAARAAN
jgi:hypothetical protein